MSVARVLSRAGLTVVEKDKLAQLREAIDRLYVDRRRGTQVEALETVKAIAKSL